MKLRYIIEARGWYIPQIQDKEDNWIDICLKHVPKNSQLWSVAYNLGEYSLGGNVFHFRPNKGQNLEDMSIIYKNDIKCAAFLGAFKLFYSERTKELDL